MLESGVVEGPTASSIVRALYAVAFMGGCAQLAGLGEGTDVSRGAAIIPDGVEPRTDANITISPTTLDYGMLGCGADSPEKLISITNGGSLPANYEVKLPDGTAYRLGPNAKGVLPPKTSTTVAVIGTPRLAGDNVADLFVSAGEALQPVHVTMKGTGPTFELTQSTIAFGEVRKENGSTPVDVEVNNRGSDALSVAAFTSTDPNFDVVWPSKPGAFSVPAGGSGTFSVVLKQATSPDGAALSSTIKPTITKVCGAAPSLVASGQRVTSDITVSPIDWGKQDCGTLPGPRDVVIKNYANFTASYAIDTAASPSFVAVDKSIGTIAAATVATTPAVATIQVTPKRLATTAPLPNVTEQLGIVISSGAPGASGRRNAALHVDTRGAIITFTPATVAFTADGSKSFTVDNTGNENVLLYWDLQRATGAWSGGGPGIVNGGASGTGTFTLKNGNAGDTARLVPTQVLFTGKAECKPMGSVSATR